MLQIQMTQYLAVSLAGNHQFFTRHLNVISPSWPLIQASTHAEEKNHARSC